MNHQCEDCGVQVGGWTCDLCQRMVREEDKRCGAAMVLKFQDLCSCRRMTENEMKPGGKMELDASKMPADEVFAKMQAREDEAGDGSRGSAMLTIAPGSGILLATGRPRLTIGGVYTAEGDVPVLKAVRIAIRRQGGVIHDEVATVHFAGGVAYVGLTEYLRVVDHLLPLGCVRRVLDA